MSTTVEPAVPWFGLTVLSTGSGTGVLPPVNALTQTLCRRVKIGDEVVPSAAVVADVALTG